MRNILNTKFVRNLKLYTKTNTRSLDTSKQYNGQNKTDSCLFPFGNLSSSADKDDHRYINNKIFTCRIYIYYLNIIIFNILLIFH